MICWPMAPEWMHWWGSPYLSRHWWEDEREPIPCHDDSYIQLRQLVVVRFRRCRWCGTRKVRMIRDGNYFPTQLVTEGYVGQVFYRRPLEEREFIPEEVA